MTRKLASIQKIIDIKEHPNADRLLIARVLGWDVVISKDDGYKVGDDVVYLEIDSFLPIAPEYEFLRKSSYKNSPLLGEGFKLKTVRLRGVISQGLILPISVVEDKGWHGLPEGTDVTEILGIRKWELPVPADIGGEKKGARPGWVEHSDETRIQSDTSLLEKFRGLEYYITTKYDGSSHFIAIDEDGNFRFGSHNLELNPTPEKQNSFYKWLIDRNIPENLKLVRDTFKAERFYIIGEWCGQGIQNNHIALRNPQWYPFTANADGRRLTLDELNVVCDMLGIEHVAVEERGFDLPGKYPTIEDLLERASENKAHVYKGQPEGIVIRPVSSYYTPVVQTPSGPKELSPEILSMKVINNKYLLKND